MSKSTARQSIAALFGISLAAFSFVLLVAAMPATAKEQNISASQLPGKILKALGDVEIEEIEQKTQGDSTTYEITVEQGEVELELTLSADGRLLGIEIDSEDEADEEDKETAENAQEVELSSLPERAKSALAGQAGQATIELVEREESDGHVLFEAAWTKNGTKHEATVTADGVVVSMESAASAESVPAAVRKAAEAALASRGAISYERKLVVVFEAESGEGSDKQEVLLSPLGFAVAIEKAQ